MDKYVFELFNDYSKLTKRDEKIAFLKQVGNSVPAFKDVLRGTFDDRLQFALPDGNPPYTPNRPESAPSNLLRAHREFGDYVVGSNRNKALGKVRAETRFIQLLESIHPEDALIVCSMVAKKSPVKGLTKKIVEEAFPTLLG